MKSTGKHVAPYIILSQSQTFFVRTSSCYMLYRIEAANTNFIWFDSTRDPTIYRTRGEYTTHYTNEDVGSGHGKKKMIQPLSDQ